MTHQPEQRPWFGIAATRREKAAVASYAGAAAFFTGFIAWCAVTHWEWIPKHLSPLYAVWRPHGLTGRHLLPLAVFGLYLALLPRCTKLDQRISLTLLLFVATLLALSLTVAAMNEGTRAWAAPFKRYGLEYYGDATFVRTPWEFLRRFAEYQPNLSMHGRTHPPGPALLLWASGLFATGNVTAVAVAMVCLAALTVVPLYKLTQDLAGRNAALVAAALYVVSPTIVLYNATCMNGVYALFSVTSLWLFVRAMEGRTRLYAPLMGLCFAATWFMSFDMANLGTFFAVMFVFGMVDPARRRKTVVATTLMLAAFTAFYVLLYVTTGFNVISALITATAQVREDLHSMDLYTPRASYWAWRFGNPFEVFFFAGVPIAALFFAEWTSRARAKAWRTREDQYLLAALAMLVVFNFTYLGKGESARVSSYYFPFILVPAAIYLERTCREAGSNRLLTLSLAVLFAQTWLMETVLYLYW